LQKGISSGGHKVISLLIDLLTTVHINMPDYLLHVTSGKGLDLDVWTLFTQDNSHTIK